VRPKKQRLNHGRYAEARDFAQSECSDHEVNQRRFSLSMFRPTTVQQPKELLAFLFASLPEVEKNKMRQSLKFEAIRVNGRATTQFDHPLRPGDVASMRYEKNLRTCNRLPAAMQILN
jgi:hypothetical protein